VLNIDNQGMVAGSGRIIARRFPQLERGPMPAVCGIVVHQTDASTARATFNKYSGSRPEGAHFLIDRDGTIYQTASVKMRTPHVGRLKPRCLAEMKCAPAEFKGKSYSEINAIEMTKAVPARYPSNLDSIGIELVGKASLPPGVTPPPGATPDEVERFRGTHSVYEQVTGAQNVALRWLIDELCGSLHVPVSEVHRHPTVSRKNPTEASTANWQ
jgi:N-acetyl-anhydromuramyl-L-alanine amidase AmpD